MAEQNFLDKVCEVLEVPSENLSDEERTITVMQIIKLIDIIRCSEISSNLMKSDKQDEINKALRERGMIADFEVGMKITVNGNTVPDDVIERTLLLKEKLNKFELEELNDEEREFFIKWKETICKLNS